MPEAKTTRVGVLMRQCKPYPAYKNAGVQWLGEIPDAWLLKRLKRVVQFRGGGTPTKGNLAYWRGEIPWVSPKDMKVSLIVDSEDKITPEAVRDSATKMIPAGAVLLVVRSGILVHSIPVARTGCEVTLNQDLKALIPNTEVAAEYLMYLISGMQRQLLFEWKREGATVESLELELVANTRIPLPCATEQRGIAEFLDRETARIDMLVAKKQRLIELLQEKRTSIITRAVTTGLDPNVPMKNSGTEWLGEIPAHWEVKRLRDISPSLGVGVVVNPSQFVVDDGLPFLYGGDIGEGQIYGEQARRISPQDSRRLPKSQLRPGDLVMVRVGAPGVTAVVPPEFDGANCASMLVIRRDLAVASSWLCYALNSRYVRSQVEVVQYGAAQEQFNVSHAVNFLVAVPPLAEQEHIGAFLDRETMKLDALTTKVNEAIDRLKELRTALISAAVTGKIDVRSSSN
jgi:type I restriction enzyme S subunit